MKVNEKKRKLILVSVTFALCLTIMLSGTFAWKSISQYALNETMGEMTNPGGRLHDDFNGSNKDIYVENFTSTTDGMTIIVRIRLYEYMEIGEDAGKDVPDPSTWDVYIPGGQTPEHYGYWNWTLGGKTVYMPTFDKNKDSKESDTNGSYEGTTQGDAIHFDDYKVYQVGDTASGTAIYDADDNADYDSGVTTVTENHVAKETIVGTVKSMGEWASNPVLGDFWVYDTDGWAYWANPLMPDTATGLLLSQIQLNQVMTERWYYGIYVESQMVTADEVGSESEEVGFYGPDAKKEPSAVARLLLDKIIDKIGYTPSSDGSTEDSDAENTDTAALADLEVTDKDLSSALKSDQDEAEEVLTESEENEEDEKSANDEEEAEGSEITDEDTEDETNTNPNPPDGEGSEDGVNSEVGINSEDGEDKNTTPDDVTTGSGETENPDNGDSAAGSETDPNDTLTNSGESGNTNNDNITGGTDTKTDNPGQAGTSENEGTVEQETGTEQTGLSEESGNTTETETTS